MRTVKYHLYAAPFNKDTATIALNEPYSKVSKTHVLLYKQGRKPDGYKEVTEENIPMLPTSDRKWLMEVNNVIMREFLLKHKDEEERANKKFLEEFERELEAERQKIQQGSGEACKE